MQEEAPVYSHYQPWEVCPKVVEGGSGAMKERTWPHSIPLQPRWGHSKEASAKENIFSDSFSTLTVPSTLIKTCYSAMVFLNACSKKAIAWGEIKSWKRLVSPRKHGVPAYLGSNIWTTSDAPDVKEKHEKKTSGNKYKRKNLEQINWKIGLCFLVLLWGQLLNITRGYKHSSNWKCF